MTVRKYFTRAEEIHSLIGKFPEEATLNRELSSEERLDIYEAHLPNRWQMNLYALGFDPIEHTLQDLMDHAECQEVIDGMSTQKQNNANNKKPQ